MSIVLQLAKQNAILRRNNLQYQLLQNNALRHSMLRNSFLGNNLEDVFMRENALDLDNISCETELMALNSELSALNNYSSQNSLNYLA